MTKTHKLTRKHIASEYADSDGYWIDLKAGWRWEADYVHGIHEDTLRAAYAERVVPCDCTQCKEGEDSSARRGHAITNKLNEAGIECHMIWD